MIFGKGECGRTRRTSNENLTKSTKIAAFWQGSFYSWLAYSNVYVFSSSPTSKVTVPPKFLFSLILTSYFLFLPEFSHPKQDTDTQINAKIIKIVFLNFIAHFLLMCGLSLSSQFYHTKTALSISDKIFFRIVNCQTKSNT